LISDSVFDELANQQDFNLRRIDIVRVKGKETPIVLYEVFDTDNVEVIQKKKAIQSNFSKAMEFYKKGDFSQALELFKQCNSDCPEDTVSPAYIKRCTTLARIPPGKDWAGISTL
jgi:adenylate cyclase